MSFLITFDENRLDIRCKDRKTPSPMWTSSNRKKIFVGEIIDGLPEDVCSCGWEQDAQKLEKYQGAFSVVSCKESMCYLASFYGGIETLYYYCNKKKFMVSDNYWEIVKEVKPKYEDLDVEAIKKMMVLGYTTIEGNTFIKHCSILRPGHKVVYSSKDNNCVDEIYIEFRTKSKITDIDDAVSQIDRALDDAMKSIRRMCGDVTYGLGISGGLDSRVIPHYALKNNMRLTCFNNCIKRPKTFLLSRSCKNARKIAKIYGLQYKEIEWTTKKLKEKKKLKLEFYPMGPQDSGTDICKYEVDEFPQFDVLLTGGSGTVIGATLHKDIETMSNEDIIDYIIRYYGRNMGNTVTTSRIQRGIEFIFGTKLDGNKKKNKCMDLVGDDVKNNVRYEITQFVLERKQNGFTNFDILYDYGINVVSYQNRYGAYESRFGSKRSFSIYIPFLLRKCLDFSPELLEDRFVLEELIRKKIPEVSEIRAETFLDSPKKNGKRYYKLHRILLIVSYLLRGNGSYTYHYYYKKKEIQREFFSDMNNSNEWFYRIFPVQNKIKDIAKQDFKTFFSVWDMKQIIDVLEKREYEGFESI